MNNSQLKLSPSPSILQSSTPHQPLSLNAIYSSHRALSVPVSVASSLRSAAGRGAAPPVVRRPGPVAGRAAAQPARSAGGAAAAGAPPAQRRQQSPAEEHSADAAATEGGGWGERDQSAPRGVVRMRTVVGIAQNASKT